jgi:hypothetical protein
VIYAVPEGEASNRLQRAGFLPADTWGASDGGDRAAAGRAHGREIEGGRPELHDLGPSVPDRFQGVAKRCLGLSMRAAADGGGDWAIWGGDLGRDRPRIQIERDHTIRAV